MPIFLWVMLLPAILLIGWCFSEYLRRSRLRRFGDPAVMGVSDRWALRIAVLLALLLGLSAAAALLPLPVSRVEDATQFIPAISILLDTHSLEYAGDRPWRTLEDTVEAILLQAPSARFRVLDSGRPEGVLVPATRDAKGLLHIVSRLRFEPALGPGIDLGRALPSPGGRDDAAPGGLTIIVTAMPDDEMKRLEATISNGSVDAVIAWISRDSSTVQYGTFSGLDGWTWHFQPTRMGEVLRSSLNQKTATARMSLVQWFALAALLLLWGESIGNLAARARGREVPFA